ncbi:hypothetical protein [Hydrogenophaga sp. 5NK40-0174]|uniref:hypothetical protein n=1 Tax=Hydrogenophaga sp. 5NK40-0174 TaxID=3127649 RepID=UPI0031062F76
MIAIKAARKYIESHPKDADAKALSELVMALETEGQIAVPKLYSLNFRNFELAVDILKEWRLDRYYSSKMRLLDLAAQLSKLTEDPAKAA